MVKASLRNLRIVFNEVADTREPSYPYLEGPENSIYWFIYWKTIPKCFLYEDLFKAQNVYFLRRRDVLA